MPTEASITVMPAWPASTGNSVTKVFNISLGAGARTAESGQSAPPLPRKLTEPLPPAPRCLKQFLFHMFHVCSSLFFVSKLTCRLTAVPRYMRGWLLHFTLPQLPSRTFIVKRQALISEEYQRKTSLYNFQIFLLQHYLYQVQRVKTVRLTLRLSASPFFSHPSQYSTSFLWMQVQILFAKREAAHLGSPIHTAFAFLFQQFLHF